MRRTIERHALLRPGDRVAVAVSGGPDSVALLRLLLELREELGLVLSTVHFNHHIRGAAADEDERFVRELAANFGLDIHVGSTDVPVLAREHALSLETAARAARYNFFATLGAAQRLRAIATGHTVDDQAETVVMNLVRGAGTQGLSGIFPAREIAPGVHVVRPLLDVARADVLDYLRSLDQPWREDASNLDLKHTRNRVRHEVLPRLAAINPRSPQAIANLATLARAEQQYWDQLVARSAAAIVSSVAGPGGLPAWHIDIPVLLRQPQALQRRVLHHAISLELEFDDVEAVLDLAAGPLGRRRDLHDGHVAVCQKDRILIHRIAAPGDYSLPLPVPGETVVPALHILLRANFTEVTGADPRYNRARFLGVEGLGSLLVRNWRAGDRFWQANTSGPEKVKRLLQERRVTGDQRALWPVVESGGEIVWMYGFGVAENRLARQGQAVVIEAEPAEIR